MPWLTGKPASIADAFGRWLCGGERWGGDESQKLHRSSIAVISKTKRPKSRQLWRLLDQGRSKREEDPARLSATIRLPGPSPYDCNATLGGKIAVLVYVNLHICVTRRMGYGDQRSMYCL